MVVWLRFSQDDANQIVGIGIIVTVSHFRCDFVIGLGHNLRQINAGGVVTQSAEWCNVSHSRKGNCTSPTALRLLRNSRQCERTSTRGSRRFRATGLEAAKLQTASGFDSYFTNGFLPRR